MRKRGDKLDLTNQHGRLRVPRVYYISMTEDGSTDARWSSLHPNNWINRRRLKNNFTCRAGHLSKKQMVGGEVRGEEW